MKLDLNKYRRVCVPIIQEYLRINPRRKIQDSISNLSIITGAPVLAVYYYVQELQGYTQDLTASIERVKVFYKITEVTGGLYENNQSS